MSDKLIYRRIQFDGGGLSFIFILVAIQILFTNGIYLATGLVCFGIIFYHLQQPLKPSIFSIIFLYHLIQVMAGVWLSNYIEKDINYRSEHLATATMVSYVGMMVMFMPIIYYQNKVPNISLEKFRKYAEKLSIEKTFKAYIVAFFVTNALLGIAFLIPGLSQVIFSFLNIKWFFFLLFGFQAFLKKRMIKQFIGFASFEFGIGFFNYFSDFKTVLFFVAFLYITFLTRVYLQQVIVVCISIVFLFYLAVMWTDIKGEYRVFLSQGKKNQRVEVSKAEAFNKIIELSDNQKDESYNGSAVEFFDRLQYTYHLGKTMDRVPEIIPHTDGANIAGILEFVFTPRILNPDKPKFEASVKATKYTGIRYLGAQSGVSFSLGYFADCYIDFGYIGMMFPLFVLGIILGASYFYFIKNSSNNLIFNYAVVGSMFMEFTAFEMDGTFLMGRLYATLVTFFALKLVFFPWLIKYLTADSVGITKTTITQQIQAG